MIPLRAAVAAMAYRGFRVGALPGLVVHNRRFTTASKGKAWQGELPPRVVRALAPLGVRPFAGLNHRSIANAFKRLTKRMAAEGAIAHAYSVHDLRHHFAIQEYRKDKDIYRVCKLLNHSDVKTTMVYLQSLGAMK